MHSVWPDSCESVCVCVCVQWTINPIQFSLASKGCFGWHQCHISWLRSSGLKNAAPKKPCPCYGFSPSLQPHKQIPNGYSTSVGGGRRATDRDYLYEDEREPYKGFRAGIRGCRSGLNKVLGNFKERISKCWSALYLHLPAIPYLSNTLNAT